MNPQEETKETLKVTLTKLSTEYGIPIKEVRLSITRPDAHLSYSVMHSVQRVDNITLSKALNLKATDILKKTLIRSTLQKCLDFYSRELNEPVQSIDLRIYTPTEEVAPTGYLFSSGKAKRPVSLEEIFKII
jgi:uncharacterized protein (UPF0210 family)